MLIGSPRSVTDKLQRVLNAAAHVITNSSKYDSGLSQTLHHDLHWLDVTERIQFRVAATSVILVMIFQLQLSYSFDFLVIVIVLVNYKEIF